MFNGRLHRDTTGNYTCMANNGSSVVDYILASTELFDYVCDFCVDVADFSDHFPLICYISTNRVLSNNVDIPKTGRDLNFKVKWDSTKTPTYTDAFTSSFNDFYEQVNNDNIVANNNVFIFPINISG